MNCYSTIKLAKKTSNLCHTFERYFIILKPVTITYESVYQINDFQLAELCDMHVTIVRKIDMIDGPQQTYGIGCNI